LLNQQKPTTMAICPNCKKQLSCGCQRRTASNGSTVCSSCLNSYEKTLKPIQPTTTTTKTKTIAKPQTLSEWGKDRYKNLNKFIK